MIKISRKGARVLKRTKFFDIPLLRMRAASKGRNTVWRVFRALLIIGIAFVILHPLFVKLSISLMSRSDMNDASVNWIPKNPTLEALCLLPCRLFVCKAKISGRQNTVFHICVFACCTAADLYGGDVFTVPIFRSVWACNVADR